MTTEGNGPTEPGDDAVHPKDPEPADEAVSEPEQKPLESTGGPDSENVDGEAEAENAEEGGYGY
ncbi:hypothetical protein ACFQ36_01250 [Arthrobacter sp. GCM10027362]|uniref:hypothetical protein n=1 Tax=Arthrobacter sp. GCM10027362 TaxID=3273379 RepID=UPI00362CCA9A